MLLSRGFLLGKPGAEPRRAVASEALSGQVNVGWCCGWARAAAWAELPGGLGAFYLLFLKTCNMNEAKL